jgi:hypothetical protein
MTTTSENELYGLPDRVYCKYCYADRRPAVREDLMVCSVCGYGLARLTDEEFIADLTVTGTREENK